MFIGERLGHQVECLTAESSVDDIGDAQRPIDVSRGGAVEHCRREVDTVDVARAMLMEPGARATGPARQISGGTDVVPSNACEALEQSDIHLFVDSLLVMS